MIAFLSPGAVRAAITCMRLSGRVQGDFPDDLMAQWGAVQDMAREIDREISSELEQTKRDLAAARDQRDNLCWQLGKCEGIAKGLLKAPHEFAPEGMEPPYKPTDALVAVMHMARAAKAIHDANWAQTEANIARARPLGEAAAHYALHTTLSANAPYGALEMAFVQGANWQKESGT